MNNENYNKPKKFLFDRNLEAGDPKNFNKVIYSSSDLIEKIPYSLNEYGYRSDSFNKDNEVLVLGCSQTYGSGLSNNFTWPEIFCSNINKKYSRIAYMGDSINGQVYKAFTYFKEIGNPKIIVGLFPLYRLEYTAIPDKFISNTGTSNLDLQYLSPGMIYFHNENLLKFSKMPHDPSQIIPKEFAIFYNFMFIKMLEQYCESNNIKFIWSIYDEEKAMSDYINTNLDHILKNYLKTYDTLFKCNFANYDEGKERTIVALAERECYKEFKDHQLYEFAADYDKKKDLGHWGIHIHQHMAEKFTNRYKEIEND